MRVGVLNWCGVARCWPSYPSHEDVHNFVNCFLVYNTYAIQVRWRIANLATGGSGECCQVATYIFVCRLLLHHLSDGCWTLWSSVWLWISPYNCIVCTYTLSTYCDTYTHTHWCTWNDECGLGNLHGLCGYKVYYCHCGMYMFSELVECMHRQMRVELCTLGDDHYHYHLGDSHWWSQLLRWERVYKCVYNYGVNTNIDNVWHVEQHWPTLMYWFNNHALLCIANVYEVMSGSSVTTTWARAVSDCREASVKQWVPNNECKEGWYQWCSLPIGRAEWLCVSLQWRQPKDFNCNCAKWAYWVKAIT